MRFLCRIGIHKWDYTPELYHDDVARRLALYYTAGFRKCTCCGKKQEKEIILLGLNPPAYYKYWENDND